MKVVCFILIFFLAQNGISAQNKDTLYIKFDKSFFVKKNNGKECYYLIKNSGNNGRFYFVKRNKMPFDKTKEVLDLEDLIKKNEFYSGPNNQILIDDWKLWEYFENFQVFLIRRNCMLKVTSKYVIAPLPLALS